MDTPILSAPKRRRSASIRRRIHGETLATGQAWQRAKIAFLSVCALTLVLGCQRGGYESFSGNTMGTYYRVAAVCASLPTRAAIENELRIVDEVMSNYRQDSLVAHFNHHPVGIWFDAPRSLVHVVAVAHQVSEMSTGRFDITVEPLVSAWGFGASEVEQQPLNETIQKLVNVVDYRELEFRAEPPALRKSSELTIDLSGIAKGYGVDQIAELLSENECKQYLVDIGGEIRVEGLNRYGKPWQIGIEAPDGSGRAHLKVALKNGALATTGDYRNIREFGGQIFTHVIDATTGYPVNHGLASVTVQRPTAVEADALATALFILGEEEGYRLAVVNNIAALFSTWNESRSDYSVRMTPAMEEFIGRNSKHLDSNELDV